MCLFLEQWEDERSELRAYNSTQAAYRHWREQTLAYYSANAVKCTEPEELDRDELIARRTELLEKEYSGTDRRVLLHIIARIGKCSGRKGSCRHHTGKQHCHHLFHSISSVSCPDYQPVRF